MSDRWEEFIQEWYATSHTSNLEYLDLASTTKVSINQIAHNIAVVYDRTCLSSKVHLKNCKIILERCKDLEKEILKLKNALRNLIVVYTENKPLTKQEVRELAIGENPLKHWAKNQIVCQLDIKNPNFIIEDRPLKHLTPQQKEAFTKHIKALLEIEVIRPSQSRHRTTSIIVNSGTTIDPKTGKEVKGKERMVFNYKRLNDLTNKDQYSLPGINTILRKVSESNIYSKFDLKSGFH